MGDFLTRCLGSVAILQTIRRGRRVYAVIGAILWFRDSHARRSSPGWKGYMPAISIQRQALRGIVVASVCLLSSVCLSAQTRHAVEDKGFTAFEEFRSSTSDRGQLLALDTSIGFDFNRYVGVDIGAPYAVIRATPSDSAGERHSWDNHWGDPYADLRLSLDSRRLNYATVMSISVPISSPGL